MKDTRNGSAPGLDLERQFDDLGYRRIAGADEVGRGAWAGPIVAAAVVLPWHSDAVVEALAGVRDSKTLNGEGRTAQFKTIVAVSEAIGIGWCSHHIIDRHGLAAANRSALSRAIANLRPQADALVLDYFHLPACSLPQMALPRGDSMSLSIAAASIVAKVVRDRWMLQCDRLVPGYGFALHKGYGTSGHREALRLLGPSRFHRRSFRPIAALL